MIDSLNKLVSRSVAISYMVPLFCVPVIGLLSWNLYEAHQTIKEISNNRPIYAVPGALAGQYKPGLNDQALKDQGRYWTGLIANFTRKNANSRIAELESFVDNSYNVGFQKIRDSLLREVEQQSQGRSFNEIPQTATLKQNEDGTYTFKIRGDRTFFSANIVLSEDQADIEFRFRIGSPSEANKYGLMVIGVDVREVPGSKKTV